MSLLPRRRAGQPGKVAVHPGWTLSPPVGEGPDTEVVASAELAPSRWTSSPALPPLLGAPAAAPVSAPAPEAFGFWVEAPAAPIATVLSAPMPLPTVPPPSLPVPSLPVPPVPVSPQASWTTEWEQVAGTPATAGPTALHTGPTVAPTPSAPQPLEPPAVRSAPVSALLTALDLPLPAEVVADTPLAAQAVAFLQGAAPAVPTPLPDVPPPPTPTRTVAVPAPAQQVLDRALRSAPTAPVRRSTVRLGFTDASVVDLRPDDPMAKALHTVADALIARDRR